MTDWLAAASAGLAAALLVRPPVRIDEPRSRSGRDTDGDIGWLRRWRWCWSALAGAAVASFFSGPVGLVGGAVAAGATWMFIGRTEPASVRRRRDEVQRDLPALVHLLAAALAGGGAVADSLALVCEAFPGAGADVLRGVSQRLALGLAPADAWRPTMADAQLAPLARALVRADRSGASVAREVSRLADDLARRSRTRLEERARAVGVKAAVPLGLCLLPSFVLVGIVPLVVGLLRSLAL